MLKNFQGGLHAALDVSVINPLQALTVQRAAEEPGYALTLKHNQKWGKHGDRCLAEGIKFCPVVGGQQVPGTLKQRTFSAGLVSAWLVLRAFRVELRNFKIFTPICV